MSIIIFIVYMISMSFNYNTKFLSYNKYTIEMVNILEEYINDKKDYIKYSTENIVTYEEKIIRGYNIKSTIIKDSIKENIYKLNTKIEYDNKQIEVSTHVFKQ